MNRVLHKVCIWSVLGTSLTLGVGMFLAHLFPPPSPKDPAIEIATYYADHQGRVQIGLVIAMLGSSLLIPFGAALAWEVQKMAGGARGDRAVASTIQVICGGFVFLFVLLPMLVFMVAAFRADRDPAIVEALHDLGWFILVAPVSFAVLQFGFLGAAMLMDRQPEPTFPRWFGYGTLFLAFDFLGGSLVVLTKTGPLAWDGAFAFYVPFGGFFAWMAGAIRYMGRSVDREWALEGLVVS